MRWCSDAETRSQPAFRVVCDHRIDANVPHAGHVVRFIDRIDPNPETGFMHRGNKIGRNDAVVEVKPFQRESVADITPVFRDRFADQCPWKCR